MAIEILLIVLIILLIYTVCYSAKIYIIENVNETYHIINPKVTFDRDYRGIQYIDIGESKDKTGTITSFVLRARARSS